jgi:predicted DNA-binding transcriptional regulator YafY
VAVSCRRRNRLITNVRGALPDLSAGLRIGTFNGDFHPSVLRLEDKNGAEIDVDEDAGVDGISETRIARAKLVSRHGEEITETPIGELLPIYMSYAVLRYLDGIISRDEISKLWHVLAEKVGPRQSLMMTSFEQKFFSVPYAPKDYSKPELQEILAEVLDALLRQHVLQVRYYGLKGEGKDHRFEPYTLAMYKGGLYLIGKSDRHDDGLIYLAIERIDSVEKLIENGAPIAFRPPPGYSPDKHFQGVFGIIEGPSTHVELEIQNAETEARLRERTIHPSQQFRASGEIGEDGYRKAIMTMDVRGTTELAMWILSQGPYVKVQGPRDLREEVEGLLTKALRQYGHSARTM